MTSYIILTCDKDYEFLQDCLDSINRLKGEKEIIIVNNGSGEIKNSISAGYNLNCIEGRRFGFNHCHGDYVRFIDADDIVLNEIDETKYSEDIIQCGVAIKENVNEKPLIRIPINVPTRKLLRYYGNGLWSRVFKRSFLEKAYETLPVMENVFWGEDRILMEHILQLSPKIVINENIIYRYNKFRSAINNPNKYSEK